MNARAMTPDARYRIAHAAGWDAGNRSAKAAGRAVWAAEDYDAAVAQMCRLMDLWAAGGRTEVEEVAA